MYPYFIMFHLIHAHLLFSKLFLNKLHSPLFLFLELQVKESRHVKQIICSVEIDDNIIQKYDSCSNCERKMWNSIQFAIARYKWAGKRAKVKLTHWYSGLKKSSHSSYRWLRPHVLFELPYKIAGTDKKSRQGCKTRRTRGERNGANGKDEKGASVSPQCRSSSEICKRRDRNTREVIYNVMLQILACIIDRNRKVATQNRFFYTRKQKTKVFKHDLICSRGNYWNVTSLLFRVIQWEIHFIVEKRRIG